jgi:hypothetical protein
MAENDVFERNKKYLAPGDHSYTTDLGPHEPMFQDWVKQNNIPFDPSVPVSDYDMRGFWKALQEGDPRAQQAINPNDNQMHFPDYWKTPYHESFSAESQWADPAKAPKWNEKDQLILPDGTVIFDEKANALLKRKVKQKEKFDLMQKAKAAP